MSNNPQTDERLIRDLYDRYGAALLAYVSGLVSGDRQRAEDVVQETVLRAWRNPDVLRSASPRAWLFTVARNIVIDSHRARSSRAAEVLRDADAEATSDDGGIAQVLMRFELLEVLDALSAAHRDVILLVFYEGRSMADAAATLGIPEGTVKSRCYYAMRSMRVLFQERGLVP